MSTYNKKANDYLSYYYDSNGKKRQVVDNYKVVLPSGKVVYVSMPRNINENVQLQLYYPSRNGADGDGVRKLANFAQQLNYNENNGGSNIIVSLPKGSSNGLNSEDMKQLMEYLKENNGVDLGNSSQTYSGMSLGGPNAMNNYRSALKRNDTTGPINLTMYDPVTKRTPLESRKAMGGLSSEELAKIKATRSSVKMVCPLGHYKTTWSTVTEGNGDKNFLIDAARAGVSTLVIAGSFEHEESLKVSLEDGWQDYFDGKIKLTEVNNNRDYYVFYPIVGPDGNIILPKLNKDGKYDYKYTLKYLQDGFNNLFNSDYFAEVSDKYALIDALRYVEANRVKIDYNYLEEMTSIKANVNELSESIYKGLSYNSTSTSLREENDALRNKNKAVTNIGGDLTSDIGAIQEAKEDYSHLEKILTDRIREEL